VKDSEPETTEEPSKESEVTVNGDKNLENTAENI